MKMHGGRREFQSSRLSSGVSRFHSQTRKLVNSLTAQAAFTLVELLITMALMGLLATVSTVGYYAAVRGMNDRSAQQIVVSTLRFAMQRALIDELPVAVFLQNETVKVAEDELEETKVVGKMTVVRMGGRISYVNGREIVDEFADWGSAYPRKSEREASGSKRSTMRLYRLVPSGDGIADNESEYLSLVTDYVYEIRKENKESLLASELILQGLHKNDAGTPEGYSQAVCYAPFYGFYVEGGCTQWKVGDAYGFEISSVQLPDGYLFNSTAKERLGEVSTESVLFFNPAKMGAEDEVFNMKTVKIYSKRPGKGIQSIATISKSDLEDKKL